MTLEELRARGRSTTVFGWITNPARRLLWRLHAPYFRALLEEKEALAAALRRGAEVDALRALEARMQEAVARVEASGGAAMQELREALESLAATMRVETASGTTLLEEFRRQLDDLAASLRLETASGTSLLEELRRRFEEMAAGDAATSPEALRVDAIEKDLDAIRYRLMAFEEAEATPGAPPAPAAAAPPEPSWSQCGEDRIIAFLLHAIGAPAVIRYREIGAADPSGHNNTFLFYRRGGSGVLVEADPAYATPYAVQRPRDKAEMVALVPAAMLPASGEVAFHLAGDRGWNSIDEAHVREAERLGKGSPRGSLTVPATTIGALLDRHFAEAPLHLLSIDIEGVDDAVVREIDFARHQPWVLVAETMGAAGLDGAMAAAGYALYASTHVNRIYVRQALLAEARF